MTSIKSFNKMVKNKSNTSQSSNTGSSSFKGTAKSIASSRGFGNNSSYEAYLIRKMNYNQGMAVNESIGDKSNKKLNYFYKNMARVFDTKMYNRVYGLYQDNENEEEEILMKNVRPMQMKVGDKVYNSQMGEVGVLQDVSLRGSDTVLIFQDRSFRVESSDHGWFVGQDNIHDQKTDNQDNLQSGEMSNKKSLSFNTHNELLNHERKYGTEIYNPDKFNLSSDNVSLHQTVKEKRSMHGHTHTPVSYIKTENVGSTEKDGWSSSKPIESVKTTSSLPPPSSTSKSLPYTKLDKSPIYDRVLKDSSVKETTEAYSIQSGQPSSLGNLGAGWLHISPKGHTAKGEDGSSHGYIDNLVSLGVKHMKDVVGMTVDKIKHITRGGPTKSVFQQGKHGIIHDALTKIHSHKELKVGDSVAIVHHNKNHEAIDNDPNHWLKTGMDSKNFDSPQMDIKKLGKSFTDVNDDFHKPATAIVKIKSVEKKGDKHIFKYETDDRYNAKKDISGDITKSYKSGLKRMFNKFFASPKNTHLNEDPDYNKEEISTRNYVMPYTRGATLSFHVSPKDSSKTAIELANKKVKGESNTTEQSDVSIHDILNSKREKILKDIEVAETNHKTHSDKMVYYGEKHWEGEKEKHDKTEHNILSSIISHHNNNKDIKHDDKSTWDKTKHELENQLTSHRNMVTSEKEKYKDSDYIRAKGHEYLKNNPEEHDSFKESFYNSLANIESLHTHLAAHDIGSNVLNNLVYRPDFSKEVIDSKENALANVIHPDDLERHLKKNPDFHVTGVSEGLKDSTKAAFNLVNSQRPGDVLNKKPIAPGKKSERDAQNVMTNIKFNRENSMVDIHHVLQNPSKYKNNRFSLVGVNKKGNSAPENLINGNMSDLASSIGNVLMKDENYFKDNHVRLLMTTSLDKRDNKNKPSPISKATKFFTGIGHELYKNFSRMNQNVSNATTIQPSTSYATNVGNLNINTLKKHTDGGGLLGINYKNTLNVLSDKMKQFKADPLHVLFNKTAKVGSAVNTETKNVSKPNVSQPNTPSSNFSKDLNNTQSKVSQSNVPSVETNKFVGQDNTLYLGKGKSYTNPLKKTKTEPKKVSESLKKTETQGRSDVDVAGKTIDPDKAK